MGETALSRRVLLTGMAGVGGCLLSAGALDASETGRMASWLGGPTRTPSARRGVDPTAVNQVRTRARQVALTFDDGPDPAYTPAVLDLLARFEVTATFFVIGRNVDRHPDLAARIVAEGHQLENHTQDHAPLEGLRAGAVRSQLDQGGQRVASASGQPARWYRPPRGYTSRTVASVGADLHQRGAYWSQCVEARLRVAGPTGGAELAAGLRAGEIVLAHDGGHVDGPNASTYDRTATVEALGPLLETLHRRGLRPVSLDTLLAGATSTL